jgi:UDP-N-acetylglucosamine acyltransferase
MEGARIGKNCNIYPGAVISGVPQDLKFGGERTKTFIGNEWSLARVRAVASIIFRFC